MKGTDDMMNLKVAVWLTCEYSEWVGGYGDTFPLTSDNQPRNVFNCLSPSIVLVAEDESCTLDLSFRVSMTKYATSPYLESQG